MVLKKGEIMNKRIKKKIRRNTNKKLIERYPFLNPNVEYCGYLDTKNYKYDYTLLDEMPSGWKRRFGKLMCEMIREELLKNNALNEYRIFQIKEKYGSLRWYDNGGSPSVDDIVRKFEYISGHTCVACGKLDVNLITDGWIVPLCESCYNKTNSTKSYSEYNGNNKLEGSFTITRFSNEEIENIVFDVGEIIKVIS